MSLRKCVLDHQLLLGSMPRKFGAVVAVDCGNMTYQFTRYLIHLQQVILCSVILIIAFGRERILVNTEIMRFRLINLSNTCIHFDEVNTVLTSYMVTEIEDIVWTVPCWGVFEGAIGRNRFYGRTNSVL